MTPYDRNEPPPSRTGRRLNTTTLYCHDRTCVAYNEPQPFRWLPTTWDDPSEWYDDPECRGCGAFLEAEHQHDPEESDAE